LHGTQGETDDAPRAPALFGRYRLVLSDRLDSRSARSWGPAKQPAAARGRFVAALGKTVRWHGDDASI
jgi:hypothetical protein